jgi:hypothetical protein
LFQCLFENDIGKDLKNKYAWFLVEKSKKILCTAYFSQSINQLNPKGTVCATKGFNTGSKMGQIINI